MENRSSLFGIIALIIGASGLGLGVFSMVNFQVVEGPQGPPGQDGEDGQDIVGLQVGILDPDHNEIISGLVLIRILLWNSSKCSMEVLINGLSSPVTFPWEWDTTTVSDGWSNVTVRAKDTGNNIAQDEVMVYVLNNPSPTPRARAYRTLGSNALLSEQVYIIDFDAESYDTTNSFNLYNDRYDIPESGYYLIIGSVLLANPAANFGELYIYATVETHTFFWEASAGSICTASVTDIIYLSKGSAVYLWIDMGYAGTTLLGSSESTFLSITKLE